MDSSPLLVAVMGATGAGKSSFINAASDSHLRVGYGLESCTSDVEVSTSLVLNGRPVTLIDTPGFDDTTKNEAEILRLIAEFLATTYKKGQKANGIIFIHRISDYRMGGVARKNFRLFKKICGDEAMKNVIIVTNMWGDVTEEVGAARENELAENELFFKSAIEKGARMMRHDNTAASAKHVIQSFLGTVPEVLSIQREVVDEKKSVADTGAGQDLQAELQRQMAKYSQELQNLKEEMEAALQAKDEAHQDEIQELNDNISDVQGQLARMEEAYNTLRRERQMDKRDAESKAEEMAREMAREMAEKEESFRLLSEQTRLQETKIHGMHGSIIVVEEKVQDVETKTREENLQHRQVVEERLKDQAQAHRAGLDKVRQEVDKRLAPTTTAAQQRTKTAANDPAVVPSVVGALPARLGLIDDSQDRWKIFKQKLHDLNAAAEQGVCYKLVFLGRHGQGYHNVAEAKYGTEAWDAHWSTLNGDEELTWGPDPLLTPLGQSQALEARDAWLAELSCDIPLPETFYSSPLKRALDTWSLTFAGFGNDEVLPKEQRKVTVLEDCREEYGIHTCDLRSSLSALRTLYTSPMFTFELGFAEEDPLWRKDERESKIHVVERAKAVLDVIFGEPDTTVVSITAHGGFINGFLAVVGRRAYSLPTGGILPTVVKYTPESGTRQRG
ncbi:hypothetical protein EUX98_g8388 [Antrodiella citrinella]|uniref:G domain-containing protein n=1 Tax=Antrodiella citrinella TaxID=2447956 RepID=A0A4S4MA78_9APHY|nr:hypothetical protein EUX98_g8388 [Antrodiella citrinella]